MRYIVALLLIASTGFAAPKVTLLKPLPQLSLTESRGGRLDGSGWSSLEIHARSTVLFYVDPDAHNLNDHVGLALKTHGYKKDELSSIVMVNLAATWIPNAIINSRLADRQKEYPNTLYLRDVNKTVVNEWGFDDDSNVVALLDKNGAVTFYHSGKLSDDDVKHLIALIDEQNKAI